MLKLEVGKTYKTRGGEKVKVICDKRGLTNKLHKTPMIGLRLSDGGTDHWAENGDFDPDCSRQQLADLISEDIPTRTYYRAAVYAKKGEDTSYYESSIFWKSKHDALSSLLLNPEDVLEWEQRELPDLETT